MPRAVPLGPARLRQLVDAAQDVVAPDALAAVHVPAQEGAVEAQAAQVQRRAANDLARGAAGGGLLVQPQLQPRAPLAFGAVVAGRQPRIRNPDRLAAIVEIRRDRLVVVTV